MESKFSDFLDVNECREVDKLLDTVDVFSRKMKLKLITKFFEGYRGWDEENFKETLKEKLVLHIKKGDMVDIANLAMMIWYLDNTGK